VFVIPQRPTVYAAHQLPAKLLLAMSLGACIAGTDVGDVSEVLGAGETLAGVVVPPDDVSAMAEALDDLLNDPQRRRELSELGRRRAVEKYSWRAMGEALDEELANLGIGG
jgi:glycosyltransferase involved in cell wall biosynthesis